MRRCAGFVLCLILACAACAKPSELDRGESPSTLYAFDRRTGTELWSVAVPAPDVWRAGLVVEDVTGAVVFPTRSPVGTVALDATDGTPLWQVATDRAVVGGWWVEDGQVVLVTSNVKWRDGFRKSQLVWIDPADGSIVSDWWHPVGSWCDARHWKRRGPRCSRW